MGLGSAQSRWGLWLVEIRATAEQSIPPGSWKWALLQSSASIPFGCSRRATVEQRLPLWWLGAGDAGGQCLPSMEMGAAEKQCLHSMWLQ